jgi:hypothetical protein
MRIKRLLLLLCCLALTANCRAQSASPLPGIEGDSLAGTKVVLPEACTGKVAVLIFGFTKASKSQTSAWASTLSKDPAGQPHFELYQLPVLENVPRLVRGVVISSMRKGVAEGARDHFIPILQGEAELKKLVHYAEPDDSYLIVLDRAGQITLQRHGAMSEAGISELHAAIGSLLNRPN